MKKNILCLTIGLPRSGKTTWARKEGVPIVNPDSIRYALHGQRFQPLAEPMVWAIAMIMVRSLFLAGHEKVIVDATHMTRKRRDFWKSPDWQISFRTFETSKEECIRRAIELNDQEIIPVIERMEAEFEPLDLQTELKQS